MFKECHFFVSGAQEKVPFLDTVRGRPYRGVFAALKLGAILEMSSGYNTIKKSNILPQSWVHKYARKGFVLIIRLFQSDDWR